RRRIRQARAPRGQLRAREPLRADGARIPARARRSRRMSEAVTRRPFVATLLVALWAIGTLRALLVAMHAPLYAYANSYDETRYTTCFHFYPDRPAGVEPQLHSPEAPYAKFRFIETRDPMCYWSSELAFTGATALIWSAGEAM